MRAVVIAVSVLGLVAGQAAEAFAAKPGDAGPRHARKANALAAAGKCKQAIPEYNAAFALLMDPALLFNRAECLRKLGLEDQALYDYRRFLKEMPDAPNRPVVESRIAALDPEAKKPAAPPAKVEVPAKAEPEPAPTLQAAALKPEPPVAEVAPPPPPAPRRLALAPVRVVAVPAPPGTNLDLDQRVPEAPPSDRSTWLWMTAAVVVVAAAATGAWYVASRPRTP